MKLKNSSSQITWSYRHYGMKVRKHDMEWSVEDEAIFRRTRGMVGGMVQNSTNQNQATNINNQPAVKIFFFDINNKIRPTSTINIIINIRNMPNSTTRENQHLVSLFPNMPCD